MANEKMPILALVGILGFITAFAQGSSGLNTATRHLKTESLCPPKHSPCKSPNNSSYVNLFHTTATGPNDTVHYLVSTFGSPSVLVALTNHSAKLNVDYDSLMDLSTMAGSIKFTETPHYAFTLVLSRLWEYSDNNDVADLDKVSANNETMWAVYPFDTLPWMDSSDLSNVTDNQVIFQVEEQAPLISINGSFKINFQPFGDSARSSELPHLQHTSDSAQLDLILDHLSLSFNKSRFAMEMLVVSTDKSDDGMEVASHGSIDDEHTPGVFQLVDWVTDGIVQKMGAYLQWKPVCYKKQGRSRAAATKVKWYDLQPGDQVYNDTKHKVSPINLALAYFGEGIYEGQFAMRATNISFGLTNDKFYTDTKYTSWTFTLGYGSPPQDQVSLLIILVISVGLGIPVVLMIFGGLCVCIKKQQKKKQEREAGVSTGYTRIN